MKKYLNTIRNAYNNLSGRERKLVLSAIFIAVLFFTYAYFLEPAFKQYSNYKNAIFQKERELIELKDLIHNIASVQNRIAKIQKAAKVGSSQKRSYLTEMRSILEKASCKDNASQLRSLQPVSKTDITADKVRLKLSELKVDSLLMLIKAIEEHWPRMSIQNLTIKRGKGDVNLVDVNLVVGFLRFND